MLFLLLSCLLLRDVVSCPCFMQTSKMLCEAFHCKWYEGECFEMDCGDRQPGDCLTLNSITM